MKQHQKDEDMEVQKLQGGEAVDEEVEMKKILVPKKVNPLLLDKVYRTLQENTVILDDFTQFPSLLVHEGKMFFKSNEKRSLINISQSKQDYYNNLLVQAEERIFS